MPCCSPVSWTFEESTTDVMPRDVLVFLPPTLAQGWVHFTYLLISTSSDSIEDLRPFKIILAGVFVSCPRICLVRAIVAITVAEPLLWARVSVYLLESIY